MLRSIQSLSRWRAVGIHILISVMLLAIILIPVFLLWYPFPHFWLVGAWYLLGVLIVVSIATGPLLTLMVFKPGKKGLGFDLVCITVIQIAALVYSTYMIYLSRPAFQVFAYDRFNLVSTRDVDMSSLSDPGLVAGFHPGPRLIYAERPTRQDEITALLMTSISGGPDLERRPDRYRPYQAHADAVVAAATPLSDLADNPQEAQAVADFLASHGGTLADYRYLPLMGSSGSITQVISAEDAQPVNTLFIDPW